MATENELKEIEKKLENAKRQIAIIANQQVSLSNEINEQRQTITSLNQTKDQLEEELQKLNQEITSRRQSRKDSLNQKEKELRQQEETLKESQSESIEKEKSLTKREVDLKAREDQCQIIERHNADRKEYLNKVEKDLSEKQDELNYLHEKYQSDNTKLAEAIKKANDLIDENSHKKEHLDKLIKENQRQEESYQTKISQLADREVIVNKDSIANEERSKKLNELTESIEKSKLDNDRRHKSQIETIQEQNKKIDVAWLKINQAIKKRQLDLDLEELQK